MEGVIGEIFDLIKLEGKKTMENKSKRKPTKWNIHIMDYRKAHPDMKFKDVLKNAAKTYKK